MRIDRGRRSETLFGLVVPLALVAVLAVLGLTTDQPTACAAFMAVAPLLSARHAGPVPTAVVAAAAFAGALVIAVATYGQSFAHAIPVLLGVIVFGAIAVVESQRRIGAPRPKQPEPGPGMGVPVAARPEAADAGPERDDITGLPTRVGLLRAMRAGPGIGDRVVAIIDCDGLAGINEAYGRSIGDELLFAVAGRTRNALAPEDTVARWDGDAFLVVIAAEVASARATLESVSDRINANPIRTASGLVPATVCLGAAAWPGASDFADAVARAGRALHAAKSRGPGHEVMDASAAGPDGS